MRLSARPALLAACLALAACAPSTDPADAGGDGTDGGGTSDSDAGPDAGEAVDAGPPTCDPATFDNENGVPCEGSSEGTCRPGARFCDENGLLTYCFNRRQPVAGDCSRLNCLNQLNTGCECVFGAREECAFNGDEGQLGQGICRRGVRTCERTDTGTAWGTCFGEVLALAEDCTNRNLDCSAGEEPTECACTGSASRPCGGVTTGTCVVGTHTCNGTSWGECVGAIQPVPGECDAPSCAGGPNPGCDCVNGTTKPCYTGVPGTLGVGTCVAGTVTCVGGRWPSQPTECVGQVAPRPFFCSENSCTGGHNPGCD